jgi:hypothetical protein
MLLAGLTSPLHLSEIAALQYQSFRSTITLEIFASPVTFCLTKVIM